MAVRFTRSCDYVSVDGPAPDDHDATSIVELKFDGVTYQMDICEEHKQTLSEQAVSFGFRPLKASVGHNRRGAYLTKTGKAFTTKQARDWLRSHGHEVAEAGRLTVDQLQTYANAH